MTDATFIKGPDGKYIGFIVEGHSGYAEAGYDIVCSSISTIMQATLHGLENIIGVELNKVENYREPYTMVMIPDHEANRSDVQLLLKIMHDVIESVADQYPRFASLTNV